MGEGERGGLGGDGGGAVCLGFLGTLMVDCFFAFAFAFRKIGAILILSSSLPRADDSDDESESAIVAVVQSREIHASREGEVGKSWGSRRRWI